MQEGLIMNEIILTALGILFMFILNDMKESLKEASKSVERLNRNVAVILERIEKHDEEINEIKIKQQELNTHVQDIKEQIRR